MCEVKFGMARARMSACAFVLVLAAFGAQAQEQKPPVWGEQEQPIVQGLRGLRKVPDEQRGAATRELAATIRQQPPALSKVTLALWLASLSTEGDFGRATLQDVADTLAAAVREHPVPQEDGQPAAPYQELAQLARYEGIQTTLKDPQLDAAMRGLEAADATRQTANFTLTDLGGKSWTLRELRGKVVVVNFWATWCPPCRKEMPDLDALYRKFKDQGLVILAISDEEEGKVRPFIAEHGYGYPILLDPGHKVGQLFQVDGIPKSFVFDREGKLVAQSIDMRTRGQFEAMLALAGMK